MRKILVLNGPNLNMLGVREPDIYGSLSYSDLVTQLTAEAVNHGLAVDIRQSNDEAEMISWLHEAFEAKIDVIINPAAFTHYSYALADACQMLTSIGIKVVEVHISNPNSREVFRRQSVISPSVTGVISGFGFDSYRLALIQLAS
jgi:3-dehydroquinate dehydratase-2